MDRWGSSCSIGLPASGTSVQSRGQGIGGRLPEFGEQSSP